VSTIAVCTLFEPGHILPTLRLTHELHAAGHRVVYMTLPDFQAGLEAQGFETRAVLATQFPLGAIAARQQQPRTDDLTLNEQLSLAFMNALAGDEMDRCLRSLAPDVLLCDTLLPLLAVAALAWGIPCVRVSVTLARMKVPDAPPLDTSLPFGDTPERQAAAERAWEEHMASYLALKKNPVNHVFIELERRILARYGFSADQLDPWAVFLADLPCVPELILCASAFDFPRPANDPCHYIESISLARQTVEFPWHRLRADRPLVFCSLGSQSYRIPGAMRFFAEVAAAAASRQDLQFVLALGPRWAPGELPAIPDNAVAVPFAPQLELLERSSVVITHAGLGTIKESIWFGVPILAFPLYYDQPGNGARIEHHGLGLVGDLDTVTAAQLDDMLDRVRSDAGLPERMAAMRRAFEELERTQPGLAFVQGMLAAK
jgi:zeaxanthin glucosyltransferase